MGLLTNHNHFECFCPVGSDRMSLYSLTVFFTWLGKNWLPINYTEIICRFLNQKIFKSSYNSKFFFLKIDNHVVRNQTNVLVKIIRTLNLIKFIRKYKAEFKISENSIATVVDFKFLTNGAFKFDFSQSKVGYFLIFLIIMNICLKNLANQNLLIKWSSKIGNPTYMNWHFQVQK